MAVNNDWGRGAAEEFSKVVKKTNGSVVTTEIINADATDFLTQLTKIKNSEANAHHHHHRPGPGLADPETIQTAGHDPENPHHGRGNRSRRV